MLSASDHPEVVTDYLAKEMQKGSTCPSPLVRWQRSKFGVIPKKHQPGEWRFILNLSAPQGASFNDGISKQHSSLQYISVLDGKVRYKKCLQNSYSSPGRLLTTRGPMGQPYLRGHGATIWSQVCPKIFNADALVWITKQKGRVHHHRGALFHRMSI